MRAAIYNPYLDTLGGGERYMCGVIRVLMTKGYEVHVQWENENIIEKLEERFGVDLKGTMVRETVNKGEGYDLCFWFSDGSIPLLRARNNILHFQVPFTGVGGKSLLNRMKFFRINNIVVNSEFTKRAIDGEYGTNSVVVYPPVDVQQFSVGKKKNIILSVARFSQLKQAKNQHVLVSVFKKMCDHGLLNWKLILAGGAEVGAKEYVEELEKSVKGYPVEIIKSPSFSRLIGLYGSAKIFWSASGFGVNENTNPEKVEHFGITLIEAMSAGAVPVVCKAGGYKEILQGSNLLWTTTGELAKTTMKIIKNKKLMAEKSDLMTKEAQKYNFSVFEENFGKLI